MEIYVSDNIYEYLTIGKRDIHSGVDVDFVVKSLEQHDKDLLREFANSIKNWVDNNYEDYRNGGASIDQFALKTKGAIRTLLKERGVE